MNVTCEACGYVTQLAASNEDRANWEAVTEQQVKVVPTIIDYVNGEPVMQDISRPVRIVVARRLVWKCPQLVEDNDLTCDHTNVIIEPVDTTADVQVVTEGDVGFVGALDENG